MSKAILILDIPDDLKKSHADITIHEDKGEHRIIKRIAELKPLPQKNKYDVDKYAKVDYENDVTLGHYLNKGWNDCIEEILGGEEE